MTPLGRGRSGVADGYSHGWDQRHLHPGNAHVLKRAEWLCLGRLRLLAVIRSVVCRAQHDWAVEWRRITGWSWPSSVPAYLVRPNIIPANYQTSRRVYPYPSMERSICHGRHYSP